MSTNNNYLNSFLTSRKFYDDINYPRGINRSGDFSIKEVALIENHGVAFLELSTGKRKPENDVEIQFVQVCQEGLAPSTLEEKIWIKYQNKVLTPKQFHTLFGRNKIEENVNIVSEDSDED